MLVLSKEQRSDSTAKLSVVGRDVEGCDMVLQFDKELCRWVNMGDADAFAEEQRRREYMASPITLTVRKLLEQRPEGWTGTSKDLLEAGKYIARAQLASTSQELAKKLVDMAELFLEYDGIVYDRKSNGNGGRRHSFAYKRAFEEIVDDEDNPFIIS